MLIVFCLHLALFGVQLVTTVNYTYAIESQPNYPGWPALNVALIRQTYAFTARMSMFKFPSNSD